MTTWVNSQFPRPDFHRQVQRHYGLQTQILTLSDPKIRGQDPKTLSKRAHNPLLKEAGLTKPTAAHPSGGPGGWGGDWYVWHAPDGLRARAATALGCMQAGAEKLGVLEASYASAIIGVLITPAAKKVIYQPEARARDPVRFPRWRVGLICSSMRNFLAGVIAPCRLIEQNGFILAFFSCRAISPLCIHWPLTTGHCSFAPRLTLHAPRRRPEIGFDFSGSIPPWLVLSHNMPMINATDTTSKLALF